MKRILCARVCLAGLLLCAAAISTHAHDRSESYSNWQITGSGMTGTITVSAGEVVALVVAGNTRPLDDLFIEHARLSVSVASETGACALSSSTPLAAARGFVRVELAFACEGPPAELHYRALFDALPAHVHYARIEERGSFAGEAVLTDRADRWHSAAAGGGPESFMAYLDLGVRHILSGVDHIAFLFGMLLLAGSVGRSVAAVTGFTLGHSVSLGAAVLGFLHADARLVEAFIGFTVALVALEYFSSRGRSTPALAVSAAVFALAIGALALGIHAIGLRAAVAYLGFGLFALTYLFASRQLEKSGRQATSVLFVATACFGLVHGFGFAGFLMEAGIRGDSLLRPLLGFNLGVELGQLALIALAFLVASRLPATRLRKLAPVTAGALCGIGIFWFVGRSLAAA